MSVFVEERLRWLESKLIVSLPVKTEQIKQFFSDQHNKELLLDFLNNEDLRRLFVGVSKDSGLAISTSSLPHTVDKSLVFLKGVHVGKVRKDSIEESVMLFDLSRNSITQVEGMMDCIFVPLIVSEDGNTGERMMESLHKLVSFLQITAGNEKGDVILPVPLLDVLIETAGTNNNVITILETTVISWTKQIRHAIKLDLDVHLKAQNVVGPLAELQVWEQRRAKLTSILNQIDSRLATQILKELASLGNVYAKTFNVVIEDIKQALSETDDNIMYLTPLKPYLLNLENITPAEKPVKVLAPIIHLVELIWKHSRYYHEPKNFKRLLRHLSHLVVHCANGFVGTHILAETESAHVNLKHALRLCAKFRGCYLDMRERANEYNKLKNTEICENKSSENGIKLVSGPFITMHMKRHHGMFSINDSDCTEKNYDMWTNSPWPPRNGAPFNVLNSFMERANDVLDLVKTAQHFKNLECVAHIGGVGNRSLDTIVCEIHERFNSAMTHFMTLTEHNVLHVSSHDQDFEKEFFAFRSLVRDLEAQMAHVMRICFDRCVNTTAHIRLLEVFAGVSGRECVQSSLSDKLDNIVSGMMDEVLTVQEIIERNATSPNHSHMPYTASRVCWLKALKSRISKPMEKLKNTIPEIMNNNNGWKLRTLYDNVMSTIAEELHAIEYKWRREIKSELSSKLTQNLFVSDGDPHIKVNLDPALLLVLREAVYVSPPDNLPPTIVSLLEQVDINTLKVVSARLETIASHYNKFRDKIRPHEEQLFTAKIQNIEELLQQGKSLLTWKSLETDDFIEEATSLILEDGYKKLRAVQSAQSEIEAKVAHWHKYLCDSLFTSDDACYIEDWIIKQKEYFPCQVSEGYSVLANMYGNKISNLVQSVHKLLEISESSPAWQSYISYLDNLISVGLSAAMKDTLTQLYNLIALNDPNDVPKILVQIELVGGVVQYHPPIDKESADTSVQEMVSNWITQMVNYCELIPRLVPDKASYAQILGNTPDITDLISKIQKIMDDNHHSCQDLQHHYMNYSYLWKDDVHQSFAHFISGRTTSATGRATPESVPSSRPGSIVSNSILLGNAERNFLAPTTSGSTASVGRVPTLDDFDKKIAMYQAAFNSINNAGDEECIGWLRVDIKPIKQVLTTHASRWIYVYTEYLINQCNRMLGNIEEFLLETEPQIEQLIKTLSSGPTDAAIAPSAYMQLVELFNKVTSKQQEFDSKFGAVRKTVQLLNKYNFHMEKEEFFLAAPSRWSNLRAKVVLAKQRIAPKMQLRSEQISTDLHAFAQQCQKTREDFAGCEAFLRSCSFQTAQDLIKDFKTKVSVLEEESRNLVELQELLDAHIVDFTCITEFKSDIEILEKVWISYRNMKGHHTLWRSSAWKSLNLSSVSYETECQLEELRCIPDKAHKWDVYEGILHCILEITGTVPVIKSLLNPSMRPRHWKMLVRTLGAQHTIAPDKFQELTLKEMLDLGLLGNKDEIMAICQRAETDVQMEFSLQNCEEVWLSKVFDLKSIVRKRVNIKLQGDYDTNARLDLMKSTRDSQAIAFSSDGRSRAFSMTSKDSKITDINSYMEADPVSILTNTDSIFECLWNHEMILDSIMSPGSAFSDDVSKWQKKLQTVEQALKTWVSVQEKWLEMEEMFALTPVILSLNNHARIYAHVDMEFTHLMKSVTENPNVVQQCCKPGVLSALRGMLDKLTACEKSLTEFTKLQCDRFPRFFFLSSKDVFHIMCHGHDLEAMSTYIGRLLPAVKSLEVEDDKMNSVISVSSFLGETLELQEPVPTDIDVFEWLSSLLAILRKSVFADIEAAMQANNAGLELMELTEESWVFNHTSESVALVVQTKMGEEVHRAHKAKCGGDQYAMSQLLDIINSYISKLQEILKTAGQELKPCVVAEEDVPPSEDDLPESVLQCTHVPDKRSDKQSDKHVPAEDTKPPQEGMQLVPQQLEKLSNVILLLLGVRNVVMELEKDTTETLPNSFVLRSQLQYKFDKQLSVEMIGKTFRYGNEYQGSGGRIISTPGTDRARLSLFAACHAHNGVVLIGERGYGKTELVKDLSKCLGETLYMFSINSTTSLENVKDICFGMAASGCHICLDGISSFTPGILSLLVVTVKEIMTAISKQQTTVKLLGQPSPIALQNSGRCFGTSLPGTTIKLPDVTQGVFRLVTLTEPDEAILFEALLLTHGFVFAKELSDRLISLLSAFKSLVCDSPYSVNNAKAWFTDAADRRDYMISEELEVSLEEEEEILILTVRDIMVPCLSSQNVTLFQQLLSVHYPTVNFNRAVEADLAITESRLQIALQSTSDLLNDKSETAFVDPKEALVAVLNSNGLRPSVNIIARLSQLALLLSTQNMVMVVGEAGCGKTTCIETVCQAHREMGTPVNLETIVTQALKSEDLFGSYGSSTSQWKDGIFTMLLKQMNAENVGYNCLVLDGRVSPGQLETLTTLSHSDKTLILPNSSRVRASDNIRILWEIEDLTTLSPTTCATAGIFVVHRDTDMPYMVLENELSDCGSEDLVAVSKAKITEVAKFIEAHSINYLITTSLVSLVSTFCAIIKALLQQYSVETIEQESAVLYGLVWAFGASLNSESQSKFNEWCLKTWKFPQLSNTSTVWDVVLGEDCVLLPESPDTPTAGLSTEVNTGSPFLHTHPMRRSISAMNLCTLTQKHVLLVGEMGVGKTLMMKEKLRSSHALEGLQVSLNCDNFTDGYVLSSRLHEHMEWKAANYYDPKNSRYLICFIDDINMSKVESEGQETISETIRQHIDHTFVFNRQIMSLNVLRNTVYNVTCNQDHGLSARFTRHFATFALHYPKNVDLEYIFTAVTKNTILSSSINSSKLSELSEDRLSQEEVSANLITSVIRITIDVQDRLRHMFLPTQERCHYLFTFRGIAHIFRNMVVSLKSKDNTAKDMLLLWTHEMLCGYNDRMINNVDKERFQQVFAMSAKKHFKREEYVVLCTGSEQPLFSSIIDMADSHYHYEGSDGFLREYRAMEDTSLVASRLQYNIGEYEKHHGFLHLQLYKDTVRMISRVVHILHNPHDIGHVLLVSDGCSSMAHKVACLAANILGAMVVTPSYSHDNPSGYTIQDFCGDFTSAIVAAGVKGTKIIFLLQEQEAFDPKFLVHICEYVSSCSVAGLFSAEEQINIGNSLRSDLTQAGVSFNHEIAFQFFLKNVQDNLRVVLTTSTNSNQLWEWSSRYPSMMNCLNIIWLPTWDSSHLLHVAQHHLKGIEDIDKKEQLNLAHLLMSIHKAASIKQPNRFNNSTFEHFVKKFVNIYKKRSVVLDKTRKDLQKSLACVRKVSSHADILEKRLGRECKVLIEKDEGVNNILVQLGRDTAIIEAHKLMLKQQQDKVAQIQQALPQLDIQRKRYEADSRNIKMTIKDTLSQLTTSSLTELRSINKPDAHVEDIVVAVIMLLKSPMADLTWNKGGKRLLAGIERLIELLHQFDENELPEKALESISQMLGSHAFSKEFQEKEHSISCVPILSLWVVGVVKYHIQLQNKVQPAIMRVEKATEALEIAKQKLSVMQSKISVLQERLNGLQGSYEQSTVDKDQQNTQTVEMRGSLTAAHSFINALRNMENTWSMELDKLPAMKEYLEGGAAISAACVVYMGDFLYDDHMDLIRNMWVPCLQQHSISSSLDTRTSLTSYVVTSSHGYLGKANVQSTDTLISMSEVLSLLAKRNELLKWDIRYGPVQAHLMGLVSSQNENGAGDPQKFPLLVDPDGVAHQRVRELEHDNKLLIIDMNTSESRSLPQLGRALTLGLPVILLNVGTDISPLLYPLFNQCRHIDGGIETIKLGGQKFQYHPNFRLYLSTTEPQHKISKTLLSASSVIDFTLTPSLVNELLRFDIVHELYPVVGWAQQLLPQRITDILSQLEETTVSIAQKLDQEVGTKIAELSELLQFQQQLNEKLEKLLECKEKCEQIGHSLSQVISRCSLLYSATCSLTELNKNYVWFFKTYKSWVMNAVKQGDAENSTVKHNDIVTMETEDILKLLAELGLPGEETVKSMISSVTEEIWDNISSSVSTQDRTIVGVLFSLMVSTDMHHLHPVLYQVLSNNITCDPVSLPGKPEWIATEKQWAAICMLDPVIPGIATMIDHEWEIWLDNWDSRQLSPAVWHATKPLAEAAFYDLLILYILQPINIKEALNQYIRSVDPIFARVNKMYSLGDLGIGKPLLLLYDNCPNKLLTYLEDTLENHKHMNIVSVGSNTLDLVDLFVDEGPLVLHRIQLGSDAWLSSLQQQISVLNLRVDLAAQGGVVGLLSALGSRTPPGQSASNICKCILTAERNSNLSPGLVKLCNIVCIDTLVPPVDILHLPSLCKANVPVSNITSKHMRISVLHSVITQHWFIHRGEPPTSVSMAISETEHAEDPNDIINILIQVVYTSLIKSQQDYDMIKSLADQLFSIRNAVLLDDEPIHLPTEDVSWDDWVDKNIPVSLDFVGLNQSVIGDRVMSRNRDMVHQLGKVMVSAQVIESKAKSPLNVVQRRIVEYLEVLPPPLPDQVTNKNPVDGTFFFNFWLKKEIEEFTRIRNRIYSDLKSLHSNLIQGYSTLRPGLALLYEAIHQDEPPQCWLFDDISGLTIKMWFKVLHEAQEQLVRLHEGGSGIWAGCLAYFDILLHTLVQEKAKSDNIPLSKVSLRVNLLENIPAIERRRLVTVKGGIILTGIKLVRGGWNTGKQELVDEQEDFLSALSHIYPCSDPITGDVYHCPLYLNHQTIKDPVMTFPVKSDKPSSHWKLLCVCLTVLRTKRAFVAKPPNAASIPLTARSSHFMIQSKEHIDANKQLIRTTSFAQPGNAQQLPSLVRPSSVIEGKEAEQLLSASPGKQRRKSLASQILERRSQSSRSSTRSASPLADMTRRSSLASRDRSKSRRSSTGSDIEGDAASVTSDTAQAPNLTSDKAQTPHFSTETPHFSAETPHHEIATPHTIVAKELAEQVLQKAAGHAEPIASPVFQTQPTDVQITPASKEDLTSPPDQVPADPPIAAGQPASEMPITPTTVLPQAGVKSSVPAGSDTDTVKSDGGVPTKVESSKPGTPAAESPGKPVKKSIGSRKTSVKTTKTPAGSPAQSPARSSRKSSRAK